VNWQPYIQPTGADFEDHPAIIAWIETEAYKKFRYARGSVYRKAIFGWRLIEAAPKFERNQPCPCESGKKYKMCCGK